MKLHTLKPAAGSVHKAIRIGRGEASGKGGTSTKGNKGGQSRAGYKSKMATKVVKCLFNVVSLNVDSKTLTA